MNKFEYIQLAIQLIFGSGLLGMIWKGIMKISSLSKRIDLIANRTETLIVQNVEMKRDIEEIKKSTHSIDLRLTYLEGLFEGRHYGEIKKTGTEGKR